MTLRFYFPLLGLEVDQSTLAVDFPQRHNFIDVLGQEVVDPTTGLNRICEGHTGEVNIFAGGKPYPWAEIKCENCFLRMKSCERR